MEGLFEVMKEIKTIVIKDIKTVLCATLGMPSLGESKEFTPAALEFFSLFFSSWLCPASAGSPG